MHPLPEQPKPAETMKVTLPLKCAPVIPVLVILFFSFFIPASLRAQKLPVPIEISAIKLMDTMSNRCLVYRDKTHTANINQPDSIAFTEPAPNLFRRQLSAKQTESDWYFQFRLENSADTNTIVYFLPGIYLTSIQLYSLDDSLKKIIPIANEYPPLSDSTGFRKLMIPPHNTHTYYAKLKFAKTSVNILDPRIIRDYYIESFNKNYHISEDRDYMYTYIIVGILMMMIFYSLAVFILNGTLEFLYYSVFALLMATLFFLKSFYYHTPTSFNNYFESYLDFIIQSMGTFFYFIFLRKFIEAKRKFPFLHKLFVANQAFILFIVVLFSILNFFSDNFYVQDMVENITKYVWSATTVIFIVYAIVHNNKMLNYLAVGHFLYLVAGVASLILIRNPSILGMKEPSIWKVSLFYYELGLTVELIFFLMALAFKNRRDLIDRTRERERLKLENERKEFEKQLAIVEAKQEERNRISTDMHDELGSGVTAIRLMSEIVKTKMKDNTLPEIDKISNNANELLSKMNTIIWTMSSSNDKLDNMVAYIRAYSFEFLESTHINCHFENPETIPSTEMSGEKRRNLFLCIKEALNNVAKHSKGKDVWITITLSLGKLEVKIHDNGVGINLEKLREFGNGLTNMRKRMENIDGEFFVQNKEGTTTIFTVPL